MKPLKAFSGDVWGFKHLITHQMFGCLGMGQVSIFHQLSFLRGVKIPSIMNSLHLSTLFGWLSLCVPLESTLSRLLFFIFINSKRWSAMIFTIWERRMEPLICLFDGLEKVPKSKTSRFRSGRNQHDKTWRWSCLTLMFCSLNYTKW